MMLSNMRNITVVAYDPAWPQAYEAEAVRLRAVFGPELVQLYHIGSTSIPGIHAKPIIDIMPVVQVIEHVDKLNEAMIALGYEPRGENGIPGRRYFSKGGVEQRSHHVHVFQVDNPEVARHLDLRDYLRAHPSQAQAYAAVKIEAAQRYPQDIIGYMDHKDAEIQRILTLAQDWRRQEANAMQISQPTDMKAQDMEKELVMYSRSYACPFVSTARQVLQQRNIPYREIYIDHDAGARDQVLAWTGFLSVPTLIVAHPGEILPLAEPQSLAPGTSPRGIDRGAMITEPSARQFEAWLQKHGFIA
jgi:GrpB-like predicted nucleotidyltransferase (UPF0157 family)/glutaredoxin